MFDACLNEFSRIVRGRGKRGVFNEHIHGIVGLQLQSTIRHHLCRLQCTLPELIAKELKDIDRQALQFVLHALLGWQAAAASKGQPPQSGEMLHGLSTA